MVYFIARYVHVGIFDEIRMLIGVGNLINFMGHIKHPQIFCLIDNLIIYIYIYIYIRFEK